MFWVASYQVKTQSGDIMNKFAVERWATNQPGAAHRAFRSSRYQLLSQGYISAFLSRLSFAIDFMVINTSINSGLKVIFQLFCQGFYLQLISCFLIKIFTLVSRLHISFSFKAFFAINFLVLMAITVVSRCVVFKFWDKDRKYQRQRQWPLSNMVSGCAACFPNHCSSLLQIYNTSSSLL